MKQHQLENANQALQAEQQKVRLHEDDDSDSGRETNRSTRGSMPGSTTGESILFNSFSTMLTKLAITGWN